MSDQFEGIDEQFDSKKYDARYSELMQSIQGLDIGDAEEAAEDNENEESFGSAKEENESVMETIYLFPPAEPTAVEPHWLIKTFEQDFEAKVKKHLDKSSRDANGLLLDLRQICDHVNALQFRATANTEVGDKLSPLMDKSDVALQLTSRAKRIREGFESIAKQGFMTYWEDQVQELKGELERIDWEAELRGAAPGVEDLNIGKQREKQMVHFFRVATGVKNDLQLAQLWYNKMKAFDDTFQWLKQTADLSPDDVYPLRFGQQGMTSPPRTPRSEGNISVSYGTPSEDGQVNNYEITIEGSNAKMSSGGSSPSHVSMATQGSGGLSNAPDQSLWVPTANGLFTSSGDQVSLVSWAEGRSPGPPGTAGSQVHNTTTMLTVPVSEGRRKRKNRSEGSSRASSRPPTKRTALQGSDINVDGGEDSDGGSAELSTSTEPGSTNTGL